MVGIVGDHNRRDPRPLDIEMPGRRQAERTALPLRRRARITARPALVFMRARKPCVRLRLMLLGWKVLFMAGQGNEGNYHRGLGEALSSIARRKPLSLVAPDHA